MADEDIETQQLNYLQMDLDLEEHNHKADIQNLRASGALSSDEMKAETDPTSCKSGKNPCRAVGTKSGNSVIKAGSCNNGEYNCGYAGYSGKSTIGANSCNGGKHTCGWNGGGGDAVIGDNSCNNNGTSTHTCYDNGW
jgi:hypothetical protein